MKLYKLLFIVALLFIGHKQTASATVPNCVLKIQKNDSEKVNVVQLKIEFIKEEYMAAFRENENILHLGREGSMILFFTKPDYERSALLTFLSKLNIENYEIIRFETSEQNPALFKK